VLHLLLSSKKHPQLRSPMKYLLPACFEQYMYYRYLWVVAQALPILLGRKMPPLLRPSLEYPYFQFSDFLRSPMPLFFFRWLKSFPLFIFFLHVVLSVSQSIVFLPKSTLPLLFSPFPFLILQQFNQSLFGFSTTHTIRIVHNMDLHGQCIAHR
jgi:hypothetical protein